MQQINIHQAKTQLSKLVDLAAGGREIIIAKAGKPLACLVPYSQPREARRPGLLKGKIRVGKHFFAPLTDKLLDVFEGKS